MEVWLGAFPLPDLRPLFDLSFLRQPLNFWAQNDGTACQTAFSSYSYSRKGKRKRGPGLSRSALFRSRWNRRTSGASLLNTLLNEDTAEIRVLF